MTWLLMPYEMVQRCGRTQLAQPVHRTIAQNRDRKKGAKMTDVIKPKGAAQGFGRSNFERIPVPDSDAMNDAQRTAAEAIINGPRKAIYGPFVPLLQTPVLMERVGKIGETLRFEGILCDRIREIAICVVARETSNQFEWQTHAPLAIQAGVAASAIHALAIGRHPTELTSDESCAVAFVVELMRRHGVSDATYAEGTEIFGVPGAVELTTLVGYFAMVCWVMNVARTPGPLASKTPVLTPFPG
jgi:4-carboxymuconolactone decarboxylase